MKLTKEGVIPIKLVRVYKGTCSYCKAEFSAEESELQITRYRGSTAFLLDRIENQHCSYCNTEKSVSFVLFEEQSRPAYVL